MTKDTKYLSQYNFYRGIWMILIFKRLDYIVDYPNLQELINEKQRGVTPLYLSCKRNDFPTIRYLLQNGADPNILCFGYTPIYLCTMCGQIDIIELLLQYGADPNILCKYLTPLHLTAAKGLVQICELLLFNHANLSLCSKKYGTPLHIAAKLNHKYIAQILINHGCPLEIVNDEGETALHILCRKGYSDMLDMIIDLLNYDICKIKEPNEGNTALHVAAIENKENIVRLLVKRFKRLILVKNNKGYTPLLYVPYKVRKSILNSYVESQIRIKGFSSLINNEETSDITLISSDGKQIYSHKIMLWSRWPNIRNKLENKEEKQLLSIDMNYQSLFEFLNYLYDDQLKYIDYSEIVLQQLRDFSIKENLPRLTTLVNIKLNKGGIVPLSTFQEDMIRALNNPLFSDMKIENENSSFFVHKAILVNRSEYFKAMFSKHSSSLRESKKKKNDYYERYLRQISTSLIEFYLCLANIKHKWNNRN